MPSNTLTSSSSRHSHLSSLARALERSASASSASVDDAELSRLVDAVTATSASSLTPATHPRVIVRESLMTALDEFIAELRRAPVRV